METTTPTRNTRYLLERLVLAVSFWVTNLCLKQVSDTPMMSYLILILSFTGLGFTFHPKRWIRYLGWALFLLMMTLNNALFVQLILKG